MGVPKFFRYISERYPCLSEFIKEYQIPAFDNLYLDMNGIIHMCSHPDDNNPHFRITEEKIFADIFHYIEVLFRMIKPQKVFFMAVDGVAPRAKMNQQRGRRFRTAKDTEKMEREAMKKGETLPETSRFDSNCITPGTEFMARLHEQLKYFVISKVSSDKLWKKCKIILSGHETPGEGEHKIMDYIRYLRSQPGYDPKTRHCLYGLDADLIMLGLSTHDPYFSLLREEVKFGKKSTKRNNVPEEIRFYLLHLSLLREYLEMEFHPLKEKLSKAGTLKFDIEKIIDDWILMGFLVGNDFIPNLPDLHIANGALPVLYEAYMEVLPTLNGYINEWGTLNLERFEKFMKKLGELDFKNFEEKRDDLLYFETKTGRKQDAHRRVSTKPEFKNNGEDTSNCKRDPGLAALIQEADDLALDSDEEEETVDGASDDDDDAAFKNFKDEYYRNKMEYQKVTREVMREQAEGYVRAIQWNLNYYYNGVCSWSWFYPHHYSPYISDVKGFSDLKIDFELGKPFRPFEQLLAVLPAACRNLLPKSYHNLMTEESSLIKDYYPEEFQTDLNGKRQEWEAVVLVPFIDEEILLKAMEPCNQQLTEEESKRNTHGPMLVYSYVDEDLGGYQSPDYFPKVINHAKCTPLSIEDVRVPHDRLVKGAYPGATFEMYYPGFPTLKHLKYEGKLTKAKVKVFETPSRGENMIIKIIKSETYFGNSLPSDLINTSVWVGWPNLVEAKVVAVSNSGKKLKKGEDRVVEEHNPCFESELSGIKQQYMSRMGIDFGETTILLHVKELSGRKYVFTPSGHVNLEKQFCSAESRYPVQGVVFDLQVHDESFAAYKDVSEIFQPGVTCFSLTHPYYGSMATILDSAETLSKNQLKVSLSVREEPDFSSAHHRDDKLKRSYHSLGHSASKLAMTNNLFSRITGCLLVSIKNMADGSVKNVNIGLDLKFTKKNQETPGYTRRGENNVWLYTQKAVDLVSEYVTKFPEVQDFLATNSNGNDIMEVDKLFPEESEDRLKELTSWLRTLPTYKVERRVCGSNVLEPDVVAELEQIVEAFDKEQKPKNIVMNIKPHLLYKPELQFGNLMPDPGTRTQVFDRIVNVREGFSVPLGFKGTVIAVHKSPDDFDDELFDVVFDQDFTGGFALNCSEYRGYRMHKAALINLSHGKREMEQKTGVPGALRARAREMQNVNSFQLSSDNNNSSSFMNVQQPNSAFASFNKGQPLPLMPPSIKSPNNFNQFHPRPSQQKFKPQQILERPQMSSNKKIPSTAPKNLSNFMPDFTKNSSASPKNSSNFVPDFAKDSVSPPKNSSSFVPDFAKNHETKKTSTGPKKQVVPNQSTGVSGPPDETNKNRLSHSHVDTDFLKRMLKIGENDRNPPQLQHKPIIRKPPPNAFTRGAPSASAQLLTFYQSNSLGCPHYTYLETGEACLAQVALPDGKVVTGKQAKSREAASENVASEALNILTNSAMDPRGPVSNFPVPPTNWVQQNNHMSSQVFTRSDQKTPRSALSSHHSPQKAQNKPNDASSKNWRHNLSVSDPESMKFIPSQVIRKTQASKSTNRETNKQNAHAHNSQMDNESMKVHRVQNENNENNRHKDPAEATNVKKQKRPSRIAANFGRK